MFKEFKGKRNRGRQPTTRTDSIKEDLKERNMDIRAAVKVTQDREKWTRILHSTSSANLMDEKQQAVYAHHKLF